MKIKFIIVATSKFGIYSADAILDSGHKVSAMISVPQKSLPLNSGNNKKYAAQKKIPFYEFPDINSPNSIEILRQLKPDYILIAYHQIASKEFLDVPTNFCIGTHPTALPYNRGRHPLHWLIDLGIPETKLSFFKLDDGTDTGDMILQYPFQISKDDTIANLSNNMNKAVYEGTQILCHKLISEPNISGEKQEHELANYWRMRTPHDVTLDLRMPADLIIKIVRSFTLPYPCANLIFDHDIIKIKEAAIVKIEKSSQDLKRIEPGKIISIRNRKIIVKSSDEIIALFSIDPLPKEMSLAKYIHPPSKYIMNNDIKFD